MNGHGQGQVGDARVLFEDGSKDLFDDNGSLADVGAFLERLARRVKRKVEAYDEEVSAGGGDIEGFGGSAGVLDVFEKTL